MASSKKAMSQIPWLEPNSLAFPPTTSALPDPNGLLAVGGDLSPARLIAAYRLGIFPWFEEDQPILWWSPNPRAVLFPEKIHISKSLRKKLRQQTVTVTGDQQFSLVVEHCAKTPRGDQDGTWITDDMLDAYRMLHSMGVAHSVEVWHRGELVGGLYGLAIGGVFFGESMFSVLTDASKVAFVYLSRQLQRWGFAVVDCQVTNPHLLSLGAEEIDRPLFNQLLSSNIDRKIECCWSGDWDFDWRDNS
ncbi:MAG: leucyl/phenylalanyl-tRNA--protein transferase [Oceanicoccus sp.]